MTDVTERAPVEPAQKSKPSFSLDRDRMMGLIRGEGLWICGLFLVGAIIAVAGTPFWAQFTSTLVYFAILTVSLNVIMGFCGQLDFGHAAFFAVGAYTAAKILETHPNTDMIVVILASMAAGGLAAFIAGFPVFRFRADFVALVTVALAEIVYVLVDNIQWIGAASGITGLPLPKVAGTTLTTQSQMLWFGLVLLAITVIATRWLVKTRLGRAMFAIREDELAARSAGIRPLRFKLLAYSISGVLAGLAGAYFVGVVGFVGPESFNINQSFLLGEAVILGGLGSILGSLVGACVLVGIENLLVLYVPQVAGHEDLIVGVLVLATILIRPQGLLGKTTLRKTS